MVLTLPVDLGVGVGLEVGAGDVDAERTLGVDGAGEVLAVDAERDGVAGAEVATDGAGDGDGLAGLGGVEDIVGGDLSMLSVGAGAPVSMVRSRAEDGVGEVSAGPVACAVRLWAPSVSAGVSTL